MRYYPVYLDIQNRNCMVVGGGSVGTRKVMTLLDCGAKVTVVSPVITKKLFELVDSGSIIVKRRSYQTSDLDEIFLVIGATDNQELNRQIQTEAERIGILYNIADSPEACNFILPSIVHRGDLVIAISTSGKSPAFAKKLRKDLEKQFGNEYAVFLKLMGSIRKKLLAQNHRPESHKHIFKKLISKGIVEMIKNSENDHINKTLHEILGKGYVFEDIMQKTKDYL